MYGIEIKKHFLKQYNMQYKHKKTGILLNKREAIHPSYSEYYFNASWTVPVGVVENSSDWEKIEEEPLLVTDDAVKIYNKWQTLYAVNVTNWLSRDTKIDDWGVPDGGKEYGWKFFSTKEARLTYIANTKTIFTCNEVGVLRYHTCSEVLEMAKKKLRENDSNL